ncbi:MAG: DUF5337 domain-containing protein [Pseudomonadota bacterium]
MPQGDDGRNDQGRQGRTIALVIAGTALLYIVAQGIGRALGFDQRTLALFDLIALGGFLWCIIVTWQMWRKRRDD